MVTDRRTDGRSACVGLMRRSGRVGRIYDQVCDKTTYETQSTLNNKQRSVSFLANDLEVRTHTHSLLTDSQLQTKTRSSDE